jgi:hypothetical protein
LLPFIRTTPPYLPRRMAYLLSAVARKTFFFLLIRFSQSHLFSLPPVYRKSVWTFYAALKDAGLRALLRIKKRS